MNTQIGLLSDNELDTVVGGMMNIQKDIPPVTPVGGPRTGSGGSSDAIVNAFFSFAFGGLYGLAADIF